MALNRWGAGAAGAHPPNEAPGSDTNQHRDLLTPWRDPCSLRPNDSSC